MKYNFKGYVFLGISCNGGSHSYEDIVPVDLTEEEAQLIRAKVQPDADADIVDSLRQELPAIYEKVNKEASRFATYATLHEGIATGSFEEYLPEDKTIEGFIQEDIESGRYKPVVDAAPELLVRNWYKWEEDYLHQLPYQERIDYIVNRYLTEEDVNALDEIDNEYSLELPDALKP